MKKYKVYLFDFDGTLYDTKDALGVVYYETFSHMGLPAKEEDGINYMKYSLRYLFSQFGIPESEWPYNVEWFRQRLRQDDIMALEHPFKDLEEFLAKLKDFARFGIVSGNNRQGMSMLINRDKVIPMDEAIVYIGNEDFKNPKPEPDCINAALELLKEYDKKDIVYVGDSPMDILCASKAGLDSILVDHYAQDKKEGVINSLLELLD